MCQSAQNVFISFCPLDVHSCATLWSRSPDSPPPHWRLLVHFQWTLLSSECHALIFCFTVDVEESWDLCVWVFNCRCWRKFRVLCVCSTVDVEERLALFVYNCRCWRKFRVLCVCSTVDVEERLALFVYNCRCWRKFRFCVFNCRCWKFLYLCVCSTVDVEESLDLCVCV